MVEQSSRQIQIRQNIAELESIKTSTRPDELREMSERAERAGDHNHAAALLSRGVTREVLRPKRIADDLIRLATQASEKGKHADAAGILRLAVEDTFSPKHSGAFKSLAEAAASEEAGKKTIVASSIIAQGVKAGIIQPEEYRETFVDYALRRANLELFADAHAILRNGQESGILRKQNAAVFETVAKMAENSTTQKRVSRSIRNTMAELKP